MSKIPAFVTPFDLISLDERNPKAPSCNMLAKQPDITRTKLTLYWIVTATNPFLLAAMISLIS